ncbi:serine/threonine-protein kinase PknD [Lachnospiraceae bacterium]|nr:serine/threonine-protein kinase PknD [Lachnospiraceae bacterium]
MRKIIKRVGVLLASAVMLLGSSMTVCASTDGGRYSYNYDYWGDVQGSPNAYAVTGVYTSVDLGLDKNLSNPQGLFVQGNTVYICDTGNNRIVVVERVDAEGFKLKQIIEDFKGNVDVRTFNGPTDIAVSDEGDLYIADKGNGRILKLDRDLNYLMQFDKPVDNTLDPELTFSPSKIVIDTAGRVYCVAQGINKGLIKYESDGVFSGFVGATKVTYDFADYIWKRIATEEQKAKLESFVPTEYDNAYMDHEGFIYACTSNVKEEDVDNETADPVRKLNLMGNDILVCNGEWPVYGDLYWGNNAGYDGPSRLTDVTVFDNDIYVALDRNRGRLFGYNDQGRMVFAFGGPGNMDGYFRYPIAIEHMGYDLLVLDSLDCAITLFTPTEFGSLVYQAIDLFDSGLYEESGETWQKVMDINGNYDLAYIGIGRSLLRQERYHEAMEYFELKYDDENYSKAYKQYRKEWVEEHIVIIFIVVFAVLVIPLTIGKVRNIKHEIDTADIFKM